MPRYPDGQTPLRIDLHSGTSRLHAKSLLIERIDDLQNREDPAPTLGLVTALMSNDPELNMMTAQRSKAEVPVFDSTEGEILAGFHSQSEGQEVNGRVFEVVLQDDVGVRVVVRYY